MNEYLICRTMEDFALSPPTTVSLIRKSTAPAMTAVTKPAKATAKSAKEHRKVAEKDARDETKMAKAAKKIAAKKTAEESQCPEYEQEFRDTEAQLNEHRIGTFKVFTRDMTFTWNDGENRAVQSNPTATKGLKDSMTLGLFRTDINNRMSGIISRDIVAVPGNILNEGSSNAASVVKLDQVKEMNESATWPTLALDKANVEVEMQSGQYRISILKQLKPEEKDQWWIVTIYDTRNTV